MDPGPSASVWPSGAAARVHKGVPPRSALGEISSNAVDARMRAQNQTRKQAPQKHQGFSIYQDNFHAEQKPVPSFSNASSTSYPLKIHCDGGDDQSENVPPSLPEQTKSEFWADKVAKLPFTIHRDSEPQAGGQRTSHEEAISMGEATKEPRIPLRELPVAPKETSGFGGQVFSQDDSSSMVSSEEGVESPMVMDVSCHGEIDERVASVMQKEEIAMLDMEEYQDNIYSYLKECQNKLIPKWNYMTKQPDITFSMRSILVDWLVEVAEEYKLQNETIYLAVNYIDRFLSFMSVQRAKLQLVGTACMFIAAKYEEICPPDVGEFVYITDDTYSKKQVLRMEHLVLKVLNFDLAVPTTFLFVTQFSKVAQSDDEAISLAQYLSELTLLDAETYLPYSHSEIAAASVALARHTLGLAAWPEEVVRMSALKVDDFKECLVHLHGTFTNAPEHAQQAMREKYKQPKFHSVAEITPTPIF